ncbi:MAG: class I SAM-dependent methyltransferase, partial [Desulfobacula sp.]|nr:class I SAM-dependent methyltransferase [Desulfobacula sp.]
MLNLNKWYTREKRHEQLEKHISETQKAKFGFTSYAESDKVHRVNRHFDTIADRYDLMNTILSAGIHYAWKRRAIELLMIKPEEKVQDVCGGTGDMARLSASRSGKNGISIVYDINRKMIEQGKKKSIKGVSFVQGDAECICFPDNSFNAVSIGFGIRNITHLETGFKEIYRVLKKGGTMSCLEFSKPDNTLFRYLYDFYSFKIMPLLGRFITGSMEAYTAFPESIRAFPLPDELSLILKSIGFKDIKIKKLTNGIAVIHSA